MTTSRNKIKINYQVTKYHHKLTNHRLNFFYANVRSIRGQNKLEKLKFTLKLIPHDVDVIVLTETWLKTYEEVLQVELDGYKHFFNIRESESRGGGVSIYVKTDLKPSLTLSKFEGGVNFLWVRLNTKELDIGGIYARPNVDTQQFLEEYSNQLKKMQQAIVFGDFNINLLDSKTKTRNYKKTLKEANFTLLNKIHSKYSTRGTKESRTIIDHVSTNLSVSEYQFHLSVLKSNYLCDYNQLYLGVSKMTQSEDTNPPRNKKPRTNSNSDTRQACEDEDDTEKVTSESSEEEEINNDRTTNDADNVTSESSEASETEENDNTTNCANAAECKTRVRSKRQLAEKEFMCKLCVKLFTCPKNYKKHLSNTHVITGNIYRCPNCGLSFERKAYNQHVTRCSEHPLKRKRSSKDTFSPTRDPSNNDREVNDGDDSDGLESSEGSSNDDEHGSNDDESSSSDDDSSSSDDDNDICDEDAKRNAFVGLAKLFLSLQSEKLLKKKATKDV